MQAWALLQIMFALALGASGIALIIVKLHIIERVKERELWKQIDQKIANLKW